VTLSVQLNRTILSSTYRQIILFQKNLDEVLSIIQETVVNERLLDNIECLFQSVYIKENVFRLKTHHLGFLCFKF
jgi:hypothetical protein